MLINILRDLIDVDVVTLISVLILGNFTSVVLIYVYKITSNSSSEKSFIKYLEAAKLCQAIAYLLIFYRAKLPDFISVNLGNTMLFIGFYLEAYTMTIITQTKDKRMFKVLKGVLILAILSFNIMELIYPHSSMRVTVASICVFSIILIPNFRLVFSKSVSSLERSIGIIYLLFLGLLLPRAVYTLYKNDIDIFSNNLIQSMTFLIMVLIMLFSLSAYLLLMKEKSDMTIRYMATTDYLTGLANRYHFLNTARKTFERHKEDGMQLSVLFLDIDYFKSINDTYGHAFGDKVLAEFGKIIQKNSRESDLSCRYGGEEFIILLFNTNSEIGQGVAHRIMEAVSKLFFEENPDFRFTISVGIANGIPRSQDAVTSFIDKADKALYQAKSEGRNKVVELKIYE